MYGQAVIDKEKEIPWDVLWVDESTQCRNSARLSETVTTFRAVDMFNALKDTFIDEYGIEIFEKNNDNFVVNNEVSTAWDQGKSDLTKE